MDKIEIKQHLKSKGLIEGVYKVSVDDLVDLILELFEGDKEGSNKYSLAEIWLKKFTTLRPSDNYDKKLKVFSWNDMLAFADFYSDRNKLSKR